MLRVDQQYAAVVDTRRNAGDPAARRIDRDFAAEQPVVPAPLVNETGEADFVKAPKRMKQPIDEGAGQQLPRRRVAGNALEIDYTDGMDYVDVANSATLENVQEGDFTLSSWFRPDTTPPGSGAGRRMSNS